MSITCKKLKIVPIGDKEEVYRVYEYIRNGMYSQYRMLNTYMSQVGTLYYKYDRNIKDPEFQNEYNAIFRNTNTAIHDIEQATGLGMSGNCGMKVKQDFSTALKNGLAKGERQLPYYKRDFPLLVPGRFIRLKEVTEEYQAEDGTAKTTKAYHIKFVNGINFKIVMGSKGKRDFRLTSLLDGILNDTDHYKVCGSSIQLDGKKIILNMTVKIDKEVIPYVPIKGKKMGIVLGYDQPLVAAFSTEDTEYYVGADVCSEILERRQAIQKFNQKLYQSQKLAKTGHGRKRYMRRVYQQGHYEKNVMRNYNHKLSAAVISLAVTNKVETIILDNLTKDKLKDAPIILRNWSYYQLIDFITYKAKAVGIEVIVDEPAEDDIERCGSCGEHIDNLSDLCNNIIVNTEDRTFICPHCGQVLDTRYNKAKNITLYEKKKK